MAKPKPPAPHEIAALEPIHHHSEALLPGHVFGDDLSEITPEDQTSAPATSIFRRPEDGTYWRVDYAMRPFGEPRGINADTAVWRQVAPREITFSHPTDGPTEKTVYEPV